MLLLILTIVLGATVWICAIATSVSGNGTVLLQLFVASLLASSLTFTSFFATWPGSLFLITWPVFATLVLLITLVAFSSALALPAATAALIAGIATALVLKHARWRLRSLWPSIAVGIGFLTTFAAGEVQLHLKLKEAAARMAPDCLDAGSFRHSLSIAGGPFRASLHAAAVKNGELYAWSHRRGAFYLVPESARGNVDVPSTAWWSLPYASCGRRFR